MSNPLMVFVHGWGIHSGVWQPLIDQLEPYVECLCIDLPGYGTRANETSPANLAELAQDLLQKAPDRAHWCGWSLGGMVAAEAAASNPERFHSLTLLCSTPKFIQGEDWPLGMPPNVFNNFAAHLEADYDNGIKKFLLLQAGAGTVARDAAKKTAVFLKKYPEPSSDTLNKGLYLLDNCDVRDRLGKLSLPCRVISGRRDRFINKNTGQHIVSMLKDARHIELDSGHAPHLSHTEELAGVLRESVLAPCVDKHQVERQFSRAANTYDEAAAVQHQMSDRLVQFASQYLAKPPQNILDMGCGTGYSLVNLKKSFPQTQITGMDLSHSMLTKAREQLPDASLIQADMENFQSATKFDLVFSNASIQWCDLASVLKTVKTLLNPGGIFAYTSFGPGTHREIADAWSLVQPNKIHHIDFLDESNLLDALKLFGYDVMNHQHQLFQPEFDSIHSLLDSVKRTGATNASSRREKGLLSRDTYARFLEYLGQPAVLKLSYEALSFIARRTD